MSGRARRKGRREQSVGTRFYFVIPLLRLLLLHLIRSMCMCVCVCIIATVDLTRFICHVYRNVHTERSYCYSLRFETMWRAVAREWSDRPERLSASETAESGESARAELARSGARWSEVWANISRKHRETERNRAKHYSKHSLSTADQRTMFAAASLIAVTTNTFREQLYRSLFAASRHYLPSDSTTIKDTVSQRRTLATFVSQSYHSFGSFHSSPLFALFFNSQSATRLSGLNAGGDRISQRGRNFRSRSSITFNIYDFVEDDNIWKKHTFSFAGLRWTN